MEVRVARSNRRRWLMVLMIVVVAAAATGPSIWAIVRGRIRGYDPWFKARVAQPTFAGPGPVVVIDEGHRNSHTMDGALRPFARLLESDGYTVRSYSEPIDASAMEGIRVLVIAGARGSDDAGVQPALASAEIEQLLDWVTRGGALLLVTDHWPYGPAMDSLTRRLGLEASLGMTEDPRLADPDRGASHLRFSRGGGGLADHAITRGRGPEEALQTVMTFTGQSFRPIAAPVVADDDPARGASITPMIEPLLLLSDEARVLPPTEPRIDRTDGDVTVTMNYGAPIQAPGGFQAAALRFGRGRVLVLGDAGMIRATHDGSGRPVGMNAGGIDNRQFALNAMRWLVGAE